MRVVVVSAHYPPNFVSGGTLQPQRLARGLRTRGHDVSVFAGWLGDRSPLDTWQEQDETGLSVRWVVTTPWTGWDDRRNYDNPRVARLFREHLAEVRPDVVHLHALQSLGAGLVGVAKDAGARVVVTMHDFWWVCARQFLVARDLTPCCVVVDAGICPCSVDHAWLQERTARLRQALTTADVVLVPSQVAADVLVANGVPAAQVLVDANGMPEPASPSRAAAPSDVLRVTYAGGPNELKGAHVVAAAASWLRGRDDVRLRAYGLQPHLDAEGLALAGLPVEVLPPFPPHGLAEVLAETDVLLLPSLARETYSILTREALDAGVPVVTTDSLGPEEVVEHERNGLVVPSGDAAALARAVLRCADEPELLQRLRAGCSGVELVSLEQQLDHLEELYEGGPRVAAAPAPPELVLFVVGIDGAPLRYRAHLPAEALALQGVRSVVRHYRNPDVPSLMEAADVVVVYRVPATLQVLAALAAARGRGTPLLYDVDDLIFDPEAAAHAPAVQELDPAVRELWMEGVHRYRTTMEACDLFVGSTAGLCEHAERVVGLPSARFANGVGVVLGQRSDEALRQPRTPGPLRIGYFSGTTTHDADWRSIEGAVVRVLRERPDVELWLGGHLQTGPDLEAVADRVRRLPFVPWQELPRLLRDVDVNLAPLAEGGAFNDAKSAIKWLEAALVETVTVASPTRPFLEAVRTGQNGVLCEAAADWAEQVGRLLDDVDLRERLGRRARRDALLTLSPHLQGQRYLEVLQRALAGVPHRPPSSWTPVMKDEPPLPHALEPYGSPRPDGPTTAAGPWRSRVQHVRMLAAVARTMVRESGYRRTAERAASYTRRRLVSRLS